MMSLSDWILFFAGFPALLFGADFLVKGSSALALRLGVPTVAIGLTIVAFGTSAPELLISVQASLKGQSAMAVGNVVGSNIANIFLILGLAPLFRRFITKNTVKLRDLLCFAIAMVLLSLSLLMPSYGRMLSLINFIIFIVIMYISWESEDDDIDATAASGALLWQIAMIILGAIGLAVGADWLIGGGEKIAQMAGISPAVVGLIFFAIGTSLPEVATSVYAARKNEFGLALGNIIGSNIFNGLFILPSAGFIAPFITENIIKYRDLPFMILACLLLFLWTYKGWTIHKYMGIILLFIYSLWVALVAITAGV